MVNVIISDPFSTKFHMETIYKSELIHLEIYEPNPFINYIGKLNAFLGKIRFLDNQVLDHLDILKILS